MRWYQIGRKDLSHFPFQFYVDRAGVERPLEKGLTTTYTISPPKDDIVFVHVHVLDDFASLAIERWGVDPTEIIRIAAKAMEAWIKDESPEDHFNGRDLLKVDANWYPKDSTGRPLMASNPFRFQVMTDEDSLVDSGWWRSSDDEEDHTHADEHDHDHEHDHDQTWETIRPGQKVIVFGYEPEKLPGSVVIGYQQFAHKVEEAGLDGKVLTYLAPLNNLPPLVDVLLVARELSLPARAVAPHSWIELLDNFLNQPVYNELIRELHEAIAMSAANADEQAR